MKYQSILIPDVNFLLSSAAEYYNIVALFCEKQKSLILHIVIYTMIEHTLMHNVHPIF